MAVLLRVVRFLVHTLSIRCAASSCALSTAARISGLAALACIGGCLLRERGGVTVQSPSEGSECRVSKRRLDKISVQGTRCRFPNWTTRSSVAVFEIVEYLFVWKTCGEGCSDGDLVQQTVPGAFISLVLHSDPTLEVVMCFFECTFGNFPGEYCTSHCGAFVVH